MTEQFDLIVIGTGSAASAVAMRCRKSGWQVAIVDARDFGGTCALRGCDPKKVLIGVAELTDWSRRMQGKGLKDGQLNLDWPDLMRFKRSFTDPVPASREREFKEAGMRTFYGEARFTGPMKITVGEADLQGRKVVIACGATPVDLKIEGDQFLHTSDDFLDLDHLPKKIVFIGGGYIAFEFAHLAAIAGSEVTILQGASRPLTGFDPDLVDQLVDRSQVLGIQVHVATKVTAIEKDSAFTVHASHDDNLLRFPADLVVHAAGRIPDIGGLDLEAAGVAWDKKGVRVNQFLQSVSNPDIYAAGDAAASGGLPLSPVASDNGRLVAANLLEGNHEMTNYLGLPSVVFTVPPLASIGLSELAAREQQLKFRVRFEDTSRLYPSRRIGEEFSGYKVLVEEQTDRILGAHILGSEAAEVINVFSVAIRAGMTATALRHTLFAYPTSGSFVGRMLRES